MTEIRLQGEKWHNNWSIFIPYEINHNFFMKIQMKIKNGNFNMREISIAGPDRGKGFVLNEQEIKQYITDCEYVKQNIDEIITYIPLPDTMGKEDGRYEKGFIGSKIVNNTIYDAEAKVTKQDIILLLDLLIKKSLEAIEQQKGLEFIGD